MLTPLQETLRVVVLTLGGMLILNAMLHAYRKKSRIYRVTLSLLVTLALFSAATYLHFGRLHKSPQFPYRYQFFDVYHYYMGAKYFKEAGYTRAYDAVYIALWEIEKSGEMDTPVESITKVRDLANPAQVRNLEQLRTTDAPALKARFGPERWEELKGDVKALLSLKGWTPWMWQRMVDDQGFNPPPTWVVGPTLLVNVVPLNATTIELFPLIDFVLAFILGTWLVWRAFGPYPAAAYLIVFGNNVLSDFEWIGWDFLRYGWFFFLLAGVACLKLQKLRWAGALMALSVCFRVFPAVFLVAAALPLAYEAYRDRAKRRGLIEYVAAAAIVGTLLLGLSLVMFPASYWVEFFQKMRYHTDHVWANHLGYKRLIIHAYELPKIMAGVPEGLTEIERTRQTFKLAYGELAFIWEPLRYTLTALGFALSVRVRAWQAPLVGGLAALFLLSEPANYYYLHLALVPVVFFVLKARNTDVARVAAAFAMMVGCWLAEKVTANVDHQMIYASWCVAGFIVVLFGSLIMDQAPAYRAWWRGRRAPEAGASGAERGAPAV